MVFYTNWFIRKGMAATTIAMCIFIRPEYKQDKGLLAHEQVHVSQFWRTFGASSLLYLLPSFRYKYEVEAYKKQLEFSVYHEKDAAHFAAFITNNYWLSVEQDKVIEDLTTK